MPNHLEMTSPERTYRVAAYHREDPQATPEYFDVQAHAVTEARRIFQADHQGYIVFNVMVLRRNHYIPEYAQSTSN